jgi:hypothetical protein
MEDANIPAFVMMALFAVMGILMGCSSPQISRHDLTPNCYVQEERKNPPELICFGKKSASIPYQELTRND